MELIRSDLDDKVKTNWFRKKTCSGRYLNYLSHHPDSQKKAMVFNLVDKGILLADAKFHDYNLKLIKRMLLNNNYPSKFIDRNIKRRLNYIFNNKPELQNNKITELESKPKIVIPFNYNINSDLVNLYKSNDILVINSLNNKFTDIITLGKDKYDKFDVSNIVYKIDCKHCDKTYIGQSSRKLRAMITEHMFIFI